MDAKSASNDAARRRGWVGPVSASTALLLLIALAVGGLDWGFVALIVLIVAAGVGLFTWLYRGGGFLALALANFLALYTCLFDFFVDVRFSAVSESISDFGYAVPIIGFLAGSCCFRDGIRRRVAADFADRNESTGMGIYWLAALAALVAGSFVLPFAQLNETTANAIFLAGIGAVGIMAFMASQVVSAFLLKSAGSFEAFFRRVASQAQAMFAFLTFYSLIIIVFACLYRIIDLYAPGHHFLVAGAMRDLTFLESLYFSIITLSTVGYGDISPMTNSVRALVAIQTVSGVLLMLFGFAEIMRYRTEK